MNGLTDSLDWNLWEVNHAYTYFNAKAAGASDLTLKAGLYECFLFCHNEENKGFYLM